jgi:two-component system phosphate regulon sensor histidine kinase PhoR
MSLAQMDLKATQKHEPVELGKLLADIADEFTPQALAREQTLHFNPLTVPTHTNGDPLQLKQLFRNLVGNAIKYSPLGGRINIAAKVEKQNIQVDVEDTGFGIPAADLPFIFDRFYRVRNGKNSEVEGNGLGLAIVKSIIERHEGQISVESEVDKGTCFSVSIPLMQE